MPKNKVFGQAEGGMWEGDIATPLKQIKDLLELLFIVPGKVS